MEQALAGLPLGAVRYFDQVGSTSTEAAHWADAGAPDLALVVADEQTAGRGRLGRKWFTPPGAALAFSLVLREVNPGALQASERMAQMTALGGLALSQALRQDYNLPGMIKWPNDVLLNGRKAAGILAEAHWQGEQLGAVILGIGVNVSQAALPAENALIFPATCVEDELGEPVERLALLRSVLAQLVDWRERLGTPDFMRAWEERLAFAGEWVQVLFTGPTGEDHARLGLVLGLDSRGCLRLRDRAGEVFTLCTGEVRLRPADMADRSV